MNLQKTLRKKDTFSAMWPRGIPGIENWNEPENGWDQLGILGIELLGASGF
jgi:hypothetical protein